jgi:hypothetical protein
MNPRSKQRWRYHVVSNTRPTNPTTSGTPLSAMARRPSWGARRWALVPLVPGVLALFVLAPRSPTPAQRGASRSHHSEVKRWRRHPRKRASFVHDLQCPEKRSMNTMVKTARAISGTWLTGENAGARATLADVRAGLLHGVSLPEGDYVSGDAEEFRADTGESGAELLALLLPPPTVTSLYDGAVRESLAAVHSIARIGRQDTQSWEDLEHYIVDDNGGCTAIAAFLPRGCAVAASSDDPTRTFDAAAAIARAPLHLQAELSSLCALPIFQFQGKSLVTAVFWSEGDVFAGPEPWPVCYIYGGEIFRKELLDDEAWKAEFPEEYGASRSDADAIVQLARRSSAGRPIALSEQEIRFLVPPDSKHRAEAIDQLFSGGVFKAV